LSALLLYCATTVAIVAIWRRFVQPITVVAAIVLILLPFAFMGTALLRGRVYAPVDLPYASEPLKDYKSDYGIGAVHNGTLSDLYAQIIPWRYAARVAITHGEWPLWNPYLLCGDVLVANAQSAPYDAINLLGLLIPFAASITFGAAMTFFIAGFFTFALTRAIACSELASLAAGAAFMFCGSLAFTIGWPLGRVWAFFPFVLFAARAIVHDADRRAAILLTIALVLMIFTGHPESILHIVAAGAAFGAFELLMEFMECGGAATAFKRTESGGFAAAVQKMRRALALAFAAGVASLALTAIFLLPFYEATQQTVEGGFRRQIYAHAKYDTSLDLIARRAGNAFLPFYGGQPWRDNITDHWDPQIARAGSVALALALCAIVLGRRRRETWFFAALAAIAFAAAFTMWPVAHLLHTLPLFNIALNDRLAFAALCAVALLAGIGVDAVMARPRAAATIFIVVALLLGGASAFVLRSQLKAGVRESVIALNVLAELLPLAIIAALLALRVRGTLVAIVALLLLQRAIEDGSIYPAVPARAFYPRLPVIAAMPQSDEPYRMLARYWGLVPDSAALYELEEARGYEAMTFERLAQTFPLWSQPQPVSFNRVDDITRPFLDALNVRYAIQSKETEAAPGWKLVRDDRESSLYENTHVLPRAFVPKRIRVRNSTTAVLDEMHDARDFSDTAWIEVREMQPKEFANGSGTLTIRKRGMNAFAIDATMQQNGWIVLSESAWRGWRAYIDGRRVETRFADNALLGIHVPAGTHHVDVIYLPESFTRGRAISFATLIGLIVAGVILSRRTWRRNAARDRSLRSG
jgi:hypothetical protein